MNAWPTEDGDAMGPSVTRATSATREAIPHLKNGGELRETGYLIAVGSRTARFRRKHKNKLLLISLLVILILIILNIILLIIVCRATRKSGTNLCKSKECLRSAANLALSMDDTVDPCSDFYQFVCGNWAKNHPRPDAYSSYDWFREKQTRVYTVVRDFLESKDPKDVEYPKPVGQAKDMYKACMDIKTLDNRGIKHIFGILDELGLPLLPTYLNVTDDVDYNNYTFDWVEAVIKIKIKLGMDVLIGFDIFSDPKNSSERRIVMGTPEVTNPFPSMHLENRSPKKKPPQFFNAELSKTFVIDNYMRSLYHNNLESDDDQNESDEHQRKKDVWIGFYGNLLGLFYQQFDDEKVKNITEKSLVERLLKSSKTYYRFNEDLEQLQAYNDSDESFLLDVKYTVDELQAHTDSVVESNNGTTTPIWKRYVEGVFNISDVKLDFENDKIMLTKPDLKYLSLMAAYLSKASPVIIELYIWFQVTEVLSFHTTTFMQSLYDKKYFDLNYKAGTTAPPRNLRCASTINDLLGMAVAYAIVDPDFVTVIKPKIETMLSELKSSLAHLVGKTRWMDDNTKLVTYRKIIEMKTLIGFPDWLLEKGKLELFYKGIEVDKERHLENLLSVVQAKVKNTLNDFRKTIFVTWHTQPTEVNAYHLYQSNAITIPMVMLQYPFYDLGLESLNYGALATILGHEITHGFDDVGRLYDKDGNIANWWTNETVDSYVNLTTCFVQQFSSFHVKELNQNVDGEKTLGENIADSGAVREAFAALRRHLWKVGPEPKLPGFEKFTSDQLFFLSFANLWCGVSTNDSLKEELEDDFHSPQKFRAIGSLQNTEDFATVWNCPSGTNMNPLNKCIIF